MGPCRTFLRLLDCQVVEEKSPILGSWVILNGARLYYGDGRFFCAEHFGATLPYLLQHKKVVSLLK